MPAATAPPRLTLLQLFVRFLRYGALAWGGPVAQIGMLRQELVDEQRWVEPERFNRVLALYQAMPGPANVAGKRSRPRSRMLENGQEHRRNQSHLAVHNK